MACGACSSRTRARSGPARTLYKVMVSSTPERVAFQTHDLAMAKTVARNYPGSRIEPDPDATTDGADKATPEATEASASSGEPTDTSTPA